MEQEEGCKEYRQPDLVCKLVKALQGSKQSPKGWSEKIHSFLSDHRFQSCSHDGYFHVKKTKKIALIITLYVDDLFIAGSSLGGAVFLKSKLADGFEMEDCGELMYVCLGLKVSRSLRTIKLKLAQTDYLKKVLQHFGTGYLVDSPKSEILYRQAIDSLMYLMVCTRPDLCLVLCDRCVSRVSVYAKASQGFIDCCETCVPLHCWYSVYLNCVQSGSRWSSQPCRIR